MTVTEVEQLSEAELRDMVYALDANAEILTERLADVELALEDSGWDSLVGQLQNEFSKEGLRRAADVCRVMSIVNPLIKRGLGIRQAYVFGEGVQVAAKANSDEGDHQDVASVVSAFWDDTSNVRSLTGSQAQEELERVLGTDGNVFLACFTNTKNGRVEVRSFPLEEIADIIRNPEDRDEPWFYKRQWTQTELVGDGGALGTRRASKTAYYPDLWYRPRGRKPKTIDGNPIFWDTPIYHIPVNRLDGWKFGIGDAFAATFWARAYKTFLEDWATLVKALSKLAWKAKSKTKSTAQEQRQKIASRPAVDPATGRPLDVGGTAVMTDDQNIEAIPKTGATIDSNSGKPIAAMSATAMEVPVTVLLADPGQTGARAVAETLDKPTFLAMKKRQALWETAYKAICNYVIDVAIRANKLQGRQTDTNEDVNEIWELDNEEDRAIEVTFPDLEEKNVKDTIEAIFKADQTGKMPPLVTLRLLLSALNVEDSEEILRNSTDDAGNFRSPNANAASAAVRAFRQGREPSEEM